MRKKYKYSHLKSDLEDRVTMRPTCFYFLTLWLSDPTESHVQNNVRHGSTVQNSKR